MTDIDGALARLRDLPVDPRLGMMEDALFATLATRSRPARSPLSGAALGLAGGIALAIGVVGSIVPGSQPHMTGAMPFGTPSALAPSTLLGSAR